MGQLNSLPRLWTSNAYALKTQMKPHWSFLGCLDTQSMLRHQSPDIEPLRDYLANDFQLKDSFLPGCLHYIVDTGCSISCSPDKRDFESLLPLANPVEMSGVTGKFTCNLGGVIRMQVVKANGDIVTLCSPGLCNPHQTVCLFSPMP